MKKNTNIESMILPGTSASIALAETKSNTWLSDFALLVKFNLTLIVVLTAVGAFVISSGLSAGWPEILILGFGGFFVTAASNILNEVLERDYDKLMNRTMNRPLAAGRMTISHAVLLAGLFSLIGITLLSLFNPLCSLFGMIALILYSFVYTPMKRHSSAAVFIGAISGAMPMLIGAVAFTGQITILAVSLFLIQFFWQFPHFWSIGFKGFDDYQKAGFEFIPRNKKVTGPSRVLGTSSIFHSLCIIPCLGLLVYSGITSVGSIIVLTILTLGLIAFSIEFYRHFDNKRALRLLFASLIYIPAVLITIIIGII